MTPADPQQPPMTIVHLTASPFFGGPERQMIGLSMHLAPRFRSIFLSFAERGLHRPFLDQLEGRGIQTITLRHNAPHAVRAGREVAERLEALGADVLLCHGYKPTIVGYLAGRRTRVPVVAVSRGWTAATPRVRLYEWIERALLPYVYCTVCVSQGQAEKVRRCGVPDHRVLVIRNAIEVGRFQSPAPAYRHLLEGFFATPPRRIIMAAGRLSPEKGFDQLVEAAGITCRADPTIGFILFGDGPMREALARRIDALGLNGNFILAGFRDDVDAFLPHADVVVLPSYTEGLPNVALEASAAAVPVIATAVGGCPEVVEDGLTGHIIPPGDPGAIAQRLLQTLSNEARRLEMGQRGRLKIQQEFTFTAQAARYEQLFDQVLHHRRACSAGGRSPAQPQLTQ
jgi:glycosyltransferase involved in cell wall biosynthesis